jgi:predicted dehydrogenase
MVDSPSGRRQFLRDTATAAGAALAGAPAILRAQNLNSRVGVACIGTGVRGNYLMGQMQACANTEVRIICDLYEGNRQKAARNCKNPKVRVTKAWEEAVKSPDVDAVIIAAPDFWHAPMTIAAAQAHKDVYVEKGWCTQLGEAKRMRQAIKQNRIVMQLGHHYNSLPAYHKARELYRSGKAGKMALARIYYDQGLTYPTWRFFVEYQNTVMPADAGPATIDWDRFIANAPKRPFDAARFFNWRCYWDYGTGLAGDCMSHEWDAVNMIVGMGIPETVMAHGAIYAWPDGRDVPDQWHVVFDYPKQSLAVVFCSAMQNGHTGRTVQLLGRDATIEVYGDSCRVYDAEWKPEYAAKRAKARELAPLAGLKPQDAVTPPDYSMDPGEIVVSSHMQNFVDCIRSRELPRCHVDRAFEEAVTIVMSVEAYRLRRQVRWDPVKEEIV